MSHIWTDESFEEAKFILSKHERVRDAAKELGVSPDSLTNLFRRRGLTASDFLAKPDFEETMPLGHRIKGNSTLLDEEGQVNKRWVKTERASDEDPKFLPVPAGHLVSKVSSLLDAQGQVRAQWIQAPQDKQNQWDQFWKACARATEAYKGLAEPVPAPLGTDETLMTLYPLGDPHIGMLSWAKETGEDFDLKIAERDLINVVDMLVDRAPASKRGVLANLGDLFHFDSDSQLTPNGGNKLDCDSRLTKVTDIGFKIVRRLIDRLLQKHQQVDVINVPGNHDPRMARMLKMWLEAVYEKDERVNVVDNANPIMYLRHGKVLLGFCHGDGAKPNDLPGIMAADRASDWGATEYRIWITGHIHHTVNKEFHGCSVESFRTLAAKDYWHHWKGYRAGRSLSCITYDSAYGEISRSTVDIKLGRSSSADL